MNIQFAEKLPWCCNQPRTEIATLKWINFTMKMKRKVQIEKHKQHELLAK